MLANQLHPFAGEVCDACRGPHLAGWQPREAGIAGLGLPCLSGALANQREAVAFPRISSGAYGYPKAQALKVAVDTIGDFLLAHDMTVYLVVFDRAAYAIGGKLFYKPSSPAPWPSPWRWNCPWSLLSK